MATTMNAAAYWTRVALEANRLDFTGTEAEGKDFKPEQGGPTLSSRALALVHLAMHDAYFSVIGTTPTWHPGLTAPSGVAAAEGAMAAAAEAVLRHLFRRKVQVAALDKAHADFMATSPVPPDAATWGRQVARTILADRKPDLELVDALHGTDPGPYRHRVDPFNPGQGLHGQQWGEARPFVVARKTLAPPPAWQGAPAGPNPYYDAEFAEVATKGALRGHTRSADETVKGIFWAYDGADSIGTPPRLYCQIALTVIDGLAAANPGVLGTADYVRLFALITTAMADAGIQAWHWKYAYDLWRPVVGIREADACFGPAGAPAGKTVKAQTDWAPLGAPQTNKGGRVSPNFPAYPSGHATFCTAALQVLRLFVEQRGLVPTRGENEIDAVPFEFVSDEFNGANVDPDGSIRPRHLRRFDCLWEAIVENSESRIFLGVHWRFDGISVKDAAGNAAHGSPATPGHLGPVGGVWLGMAIARDLMANGLIRHP